MQISRALALAAAFSLVTATAAQAEVYPKETLIKVDKKEAGGGKGTPWIDALSAYYVHGSSAKGPMRAGNLPAFATRQAAQAFATQRGGTVLAFGAIDAALVAQLAGRGGHDHH